MLSKENHSIILRYGDLVNIYEFTIMNELRTSLPERTVTNEDVSDFLALLNEYL